MKTIDILDKHKSKSPSKWIESAEQRKKDSRWLLYSASIALKVRRRMADVGMTQVVLAEKLGCTQQHVSMILKGKNNLTLETIAKLEDALEFDLIGETLTPLISSTSYTDIPVRCSYLTEQERPPYGDKK